MAKISATGVVGVVVLLAMVSSSFIVVEALAKIETFNGRACDGPATNTFFIQRGCQNFNDQSAVRISGVSDSTRISVHNTQGCSTASSVAQIYGPGCVVQGNTALNAVFVDA